MTLPEAPKTTVDRIAFGAARWTTIIHAREPGFAAGCVQLAAKFDSDEARENAKRTLRITQANGYMNGYELMTALDTLKIWERAEPGHKMAVVIALTEIGGGHIDEPSARVLTHQSYR